MVTMSHWTFSPDCKIRYDKDRIILVRFDYKAHFFEVSSHFLSFFHLLEQGATKQQLEHFIKSRTKVEKGKLLAVIRDLESQGFLVELGDNSV